LITICTAYFFVFGIRRVKMDLKQSCNVFLPVKQYGAIKELGHKLSVPYSELIREGVDLILIRYKKKEMQNHKGD
jgi:hypothetical protein